MDERDQLLERLRGRPAAAAVVEAFATVGASRPVEFDRDGKAVLLVELERWHLESQEPLPVGLVHLGTALVEERHSSSSR